MDAEPFLKDLAEVLEVESTDLEDQYELTSEAWDSLTVVSTIALIDEHFGVIVDGGELAGCSSIAGLLHRIQKEIGE